MKKLSESILIIAYILLYLLLGLVLYAICPLAFFIMIVMIVVIFVEWIDAGKHI